jgi:3-oxoacyl-[acyl-carrier protein] reductase
MKFEFKEKIFIVTGGTRGIGSAIVEALLSCGGTVIATGTKQEQIDSLNQEPDKDKNLSYLHFDFQDPQSLQNALNVIKGLEQIDGLFNNAGVNKINPIWKIEEEDWDWITEINLKGVFQVTKIISLKMKEQGFGRILNIASIFGVVSKAQRSAYSTTKFGLIGFTKGIALDLAPYNVLVNALSPGFVITELTKNILGLEQMEELAQTVPLQRFAEPEEIAKTALFLISSLNTYITGQNIIIDGGFVSG